MDISLRKAHRVVKALSSVNRNVRCAKHANLKGSHDELSHIANEVSSTLNNTVIDLLNVVDTIYNLRSRIALKNSTVTDADGKTIDSYLLDKVNIETKMKMLSAYSSKSEFKSDDEYMVSLKHDFDIEAGAQSMYSSSFNVNTPLPSVHNDLNSKYISLKYEQEKIADKLAILNNSVTIGLLPNEIEILRKYQIIE